MFFFDMEDFNTRVINFLVILIIVAVFYGILPIAGAFYSRNKWRKFRDRFDDLRLAPLLDYRRYRQLESEGGVFRFIGGIESITDGHTLWVKGEDLTIPVSLEKTTCFLLPICEDSSLPEVPEQIRWNRVSTLTEGSKVFIGGQLKTQNNRLSFCSTKEKPLLVLFYNCPDTELTGSLIRAARTRNDYWNSLTPISIVIGALALVYIAASFLGRPAFSLTVISSFVAIFVPVLPIIPPGILFTVLYRRLTWQARNLRAYRDLARLPLRCLLPEYPARQSADLFTGEKYGYVQLDSLPAQETVPWLIPEKQKTGKKSKLFFFGVLRGEESSLPQRSKDPFVSFGILPDDPAYLARRYAIRAYALEAAAWFILLLGIVVDVVFIFFILQLLRGVSF